MSIAQRIEALGRATQYQIDNSDTVKRAFCLGLWYKSFPDYAQAHVESAFNFELKNLDKSAMDWNSTVYKHLFKFQFVSETGDSWHQCYRDFRQLGWQRKAVHREGGVLQYLFKLVDESKPEGYQLVNLLLEIGISTCKQVQVGTEMKEVPIMQTVCEDLVELPEDSLTSSASVEAAGAVISQLTVIADIDDYEREHGPEGQIPRKSDFSDDIPF